MKPHRLYYFLVHGFKLSTFGSGVTLVGYCLFKLKPSPNLFLDIWFDCLLTIAVAALFGIGLILGALLVWPFVGTITGKLCGAPFHNNDSVCILTGPHRDRIVKVYKIWAERHQVRVWLGKKEADQTKDVFSYHEVYRIRTTVPNTQTNHRK